MLAQASRGRAAKLVPTGIAPAALYGACVTGISDAQLLDLRRTAATTIAPRAQGRSLDVALLLGDVDLTAKSKVLIRGSVIHSSLRVLALFMEIGGLEQD